MPSLLTVVTVVRNDTPGFLATASSLREQTGRSFEWIIVDGASTDGTTQTVMACQAEAVAVISEPDRGVYDAMNKALALVRTPYVLFLNAGDILASERTVEKILVLMSAAPKPPDFIYGDALERQDNGQVYLKKRRSHQWAWYGMFAHHQAMVYRLFAAPHVRYDMSYPIGADYAFTLMFLKVSQTIAQFSEPLCIFGPAGLSARHAAKGRQDQYHIRRRILGYSRMTARAIFCLQYATLFLRQRFFGIYRIARGYRRP